MHIPAKAKASPGAAHWAQSLQKYIMNRARGGSTLGKSLGRKGDFGKAGEGSCPGPATPETPRNGWGSSGVPQNPKAWNLGSGIPLCTQGAPCAGKRGKSWGLFALFSKLPGGESSSHTHPASLGQGEQTPCSFSGQEQEIKPKANNPGWLCKPCTSGSCAWAQGEGAELAPGTTGPSWHEGVSR